MRDEAERHHRRAEILSDLGKRDRALEEARAAIAADPTHADGWFSAARALVDDEQYEEALVHAEKGLGFRDSGWGHRLRSVALSGLGRHVDALQAAEKAAALQPQEWRSYARLARCFRNLYREEDADEALTRAAELAPEEPAIYAQWARVAFSLGRFDEAERLARRGVACDPLHLGALYSLGYVLESRDPPASFGAYARGFRQDPTRADFRVKVIELGNVVSAWPADLAALLALVVIAATVCVAMNWPPAWCGVLAVAILGASFVAATRQRGRARLDAAIPGGAELFEKLRTGEG
ncbi:MAG: tetratricopeptide repeat protein [Deltaproteobacteria bacterium]|nr:MAG: tetratricopeptide repeat protein [Deltaproteobacteria bacterium]